MAVVYRYLHISLLGVLLFAFAACGGASSATNAQSSAGAGQNDLLAQLRTKGVIRIANTQASPPWSLLNAQNQPVGYDIDVANALAKRLGIAKVEFIASDFNSFVPALQADKFDMVISGLTPTPARRQQVDFSEPYEVNGVAIFVSNTNTSIKSFADLSGKRIAVSAGSTQEQYARDKVPNAQVKTYQNATLALTDVQYGRADAALFSRYVGAYLAAKNNLQVKPLPGLLTNEVNAMALKKNQPAFKAEVNKEIEAMIADGTLKGISQKWLGGLDMTESLKNLPKS